MARAPRDEASARRLLAPGRQVHRAPGAVPRRARRGRDAGARALARGRQPRHPRGLRGHGGGRCATRTTRCASRARASAGCALPRPRSTAGTRAPRCVCSRACSSRKGSRRVWGAMTRCRDVPWRASPARCAARGAKIEGRVRPARNDERPPLEMRGLPEGGARLRALEWRAPVASAQVKRASALGALRRRAHRAARAHAHARPHRAHAASDGRAVQTLGPLTRLDPEGWQGALAPLEFTVPGDPSSAAFSSSRRTRCQARGSW